MLDKTFLIYGLTMAFVVLAVLRRPAVALGAFLCTYGLEQWAQSQNAFFYTHNALTNYLTAGILLWALVMRQVKGVEARMTFPPVAVFILMLFLWSLLSITWSIAPEAAVANWKQQAPYLLATIVLMPLVVGDLRDLRAGLLMAVTLGSLILLLLLFDSGWENRQIVMKQGAEVGSVKGTGGNPLAVASLAGWVALLALLTNFRGLGRVWRWLRYPVMLLGIIVAIKSGSRGQLFALVFAGLIFLPASRHIRSIGGFISIAVAILLMLGLTSVAFDMYVGDPTGRWDLGSMRGAWTGGRLHTSLILLDAWQNGGPVAWVIGLGTSASYSPEILGIYPHLVMLEALGELGIVGFLLIWGVPIFAFIAWRCLHQLAGDDEEARGLTAAVGAMFLFEVILSFKQGSMLGSPFAFGFAMMIGRLCVLQQRRRAMGLPPMDRPGELQHGYSGLYAPAVFAGGYAGAYVEEPIPPRPQRLRGKPGQQPGQHLDGPPHLL